MECDNARPDPYFSLAQTGAQLIAPAVPEWRAELAGVLGHESERKRLLASALEGFENMGATGHVERLKAVLQS